MKRLIIFLLAAIPVALFAQNSPGPIQLKDLSAPRSPGFQLIDLSPTNIEAPTTPKALVLGILQTFDGSTGWPQSYSMETAPYWWVKSGDRNAYKYLGLKTTKLPSGALKVTGQDIFSGLKFTSLSVSFTSKDMLPDTASSQQKVFSAGVRTNIIRWYRTKHFDRLSKAVNDWASQPPSTKMVLAMAGKTGDELKQAIAKYWEENPDQLAAEIADLMTEKPLISWDIAGAYATYGVGDSTWKTGRAGIWTTVAGYIPLNPSDKKPTTNYLDVLVNARYMYDGYALSPKNGLVKSNNLDIGGKIAFEFNQFSIGYEFVYRHYFLDEIDKQYRNVGVISYKIRDGLYINGAFGKNFGDKNSIVSLFGINWGLGTAKASIGE